jgi:hypothetical protein
VASHGVVPLLDFYTNEAGLDYLRSLGVEPSAQAPSAGRYPTPRERIAAATSLADYKVEVHRGGRSVDLQMDRADGEWTFVCTVKYAGDDESCQFYFQTGSVLCATDLLTALAPICGPFVLLENNEKPVIVTGRHA